MNKKGVRVTKQRYNNYSHELAYKAVDACFDRKWLRTDVLEFIEEYTGISRKEIYKDTLNQSVLVKMEVAESLACFVDDMVDDIMNNRMIDYIDPVTIKSRPDGMTHKMRDIASLSIPHQFLGHIVKLGLDPLLKARLLPTQHASIPGRGQTKLKNQIGWYLRRKRLNINFAVKTDIVHAYASVKYLDVIKFLKREIPSAKWIIKLLTFLSILAPDGHLIIGGYIDAWLFNLMMSYAIRDLMKQGYMRRGKFHPYVVRVVTYMDDFTILTSTRIGAKKAIRYLSKWLHTNLLLTIKQTTSIFVLDTMEEERRARCLARPSSRGCPAVDMGGFMIHRTYVTIRPRIFKRIARCFSRAWRELQNTGTIQRQRAAVIISRYGYFKQTTSKYLRCKYHVDEILRMAKKVNSFWSRLRARETKEWLYHAVSKYQSRLAASQSNPRIAW